MKIPFVEIPDLFSDAPLVWDAPTHLDDALCADLCKRCDRLVEEQTAPFTGRHRATFTDKSLKRLLETHLGVAMPHKLGELELVGLNPLFRFYRYGAGHSFPPHVDYWYMPTPRELTLVTVLCYLNEDFEGGETRFMGLPGGPTDNPPADKLVSPATGRVSLWQHQVVHEGVRVTSGTKKVLRTDLLYRAHVDIRRVCGIDSAEYRHMTGQL